MYGDKLLPGFGLRIAAPRPGSRDGRKTWIAMYRVQGKPVMESLGTLAQIPKVDQARARARESILKAKAGAHPVRQREAVEAHQKAEKTRAFNTVESGVRLYLATGGKDQVESGWKPKTAREWQRIFEHDVFPKWRSRPLTEITKTDVLELVYDQAQKRERSRRGAPGGAAVQSGKMLTRLRTFFGWALANNLITADPTIGVRRPAKEASRDRVLSKAEIRAFWAGCGQLGYPFGAIFWLLLLTAQREAEVAGMRWPEVDLEHRVWTIPRERAKSD